MKSVLFTILFRDPEAAGAKAFRRHLADLLALDETVRTACLEALPRIRLSQLESDRRRLAEDLANEHKVGLDKLTNSLGAMIFLLDALLGRDIPPSDVLLWSDDLVEIGALDESNRAVLEAVLTQIKSAVLSEVRPKVRQRRAAAGVFPTFTGVGYTVEMRAVREDSFRPGMPIETFVPQIVDTTMVASLHMSVDEGTPKEFYFQADESDIDYLLGMLQAAKKEMAALRAFLRVDRP
jgi:hypothetical protein